jgi:hypothetical protein
MANTPHTPITQEQRLMAWRHMRRPATWPPTLEEALKDPMRTACIDGYACRMGRPDFYRPQAPAAHRLPTGPVPPTPTTAPARGQQAATAGRRLPKLSHDPRSKAANDADE